MINRLSVIASGIALVLGLLAFVSVGYGYVSSLSMSHVPRPNVGSGFSESATALFGGALVGLWVAAAGIVFAAFGLFVGLRARFKLLAAAPSIVYLLLAILLVTVPEFIRSLQR